MDEAMERKRMTTDEVDEVMERRRMRMVLMFGNDARDRWRSWASLFAA